MSEPLRVLIVDDSVQIRALLAHALRLRGFAPVEADGGAAALRLVMTHPFAIAIIDQHMPGMTGAELIRFVRGSPDPRVRAVPIIGLSGKPGSERELLAAGAEVFLPKPFGEAELAAALRLALADRLVSPGSAGAA
jgi:CheY-like chemotaxis protein